MSTTPTWACFGCFDFANNARTKAYVNWAKCTPRGEAQPNQFYPNAAPKLNWICMCPEDGDVSIYNDPETDNVCWFDPDVPESKDFLGVILTDVRGLRSSAYSREVSEAIGGGSILGRPKRLGKSFTFEAIIISTSEAGLDYGMEWLRRAFEDEGSCPKADRLCSSCQGQVLSVRVHCPGEDDVDRGVRTFPTAGVIDGIDLVDDDYPMGRANCYSMRRITWTMQTETNDSFAPDPHESMAVASNSVYAFSYPGVEPAPDDSLPCCAFCDESPCDPCGTDPGCDCFPPLDLQPLVIAQTAPCFEHPSTRLIGAMALSQVYSGYDTTMRLTLEAGFDPDDADFSRYGLRNVVIRVFENVNNMALPTNAGEYTALVDGTGEKPGTLPCTEIGISWMPPASKLIIDGTSHSSWLVCNGECRDHSSRIFGLTGKMFPLSFRCVPLIVTVEWDQGNVQPSGGGARIPSTATLEGFLRYRM